MADVFVSYSRTDGVFAASLAAALEARGKQPWLDVHGIEAGEVFPAVLRRAIEETDGMVFIISPEAVASPFCTQEVEHALTLGKRIVPVLHRPVADELLPAGIRDRQWVRVGDEVSPESVDVLVRALDADFEHTRHHTRVLVRARDWDASGRRPGALPRGEELAAAEEWMTHAPGREPVVTALQAEWVALGRAAAARRQRRLFLAAGVFSLVVVALLVFALVSRHTAVLAENRAQSRSIAQAAESQLGRDPQRALLLAREALAVSRTDEAQLAAQEALDANTARSQLPSFGPQDCLVANYFFLYDNGSKAVDNACDGNVVFVDLDAKRILKTVHVGETTTDMVRTPDGTGVLVATGKDLVQVDLPSGEVHHLYTADFPILWVAAGPPEPHVAIGSRHQVFLLDLPTKKARLVASGDPSQNIIYGMKWAAPEVLLVASSGQAKGSGDLLPGFTVVDLAHGTWTTVQPLTAAPKLAAVGFVGVSPDRKTWFIPGAEIDPTSNEQVAVTWAVDPVTRAVRWVARGPRGASTSPLESSADSTLLAVGYSQGDADVLDARTGRLIVREPGSGSIVDDLGFRDSNTTLVTVSLDGIFRTWAAQGSERLRVQLPSDPAVAFTPDGTHLVTVGKQGQLLERTTGRSTGAFPGFPSDSVFNTCSQACFAASPNLGWLTYVDPTSVTPRIIEVEGRTGREVGRVTVPRLDAQGVAPDGSVVAAYVDSGTLYATVIDPRTGTTRALEHGASSEGCVAYTPSFTADGRRMAVVDGCTHVVVWDLASGKVLRTAVLPDRATGTELGVQLAGSALTADGRYVLVNVLGGAFVRVDVDSGAVVERPGTATEGNVLAIAPDGRFYAVGRHDGTVDVFDAPSLRLVRHHVLANAIQSLVFSPDGRELAVQDSAHVLRLWDTCDACQDPGRLVELAAQQSVRELTDDERSTFELS